ncbi:MAG TPA: hypothetical protein VIV40_30255, partial [Kofleriaceae bacterium]
MKYAPLLIAFLIACGPGPRHNTGDDDDTTQPDSGGGCSRQCSSDLHSVVDCNGGVVEDCSGGLACDPTTYTCQDACAAADANHRSVGCDYFATEMETLTPGYCYAVFVANTWTYPAHINVEYRGQMLNTQSFTRIPSGSGPTLTHGTYDATQGLAPGEVAILFLAGTQGAAPNCPVAPAVSAAYITGTGISDSFRIKTDVPVVAYQINPYGGGSVAVTAASLLLPTSVWDMNYVAVNVSAASAGNPSLNIVARDDGTQVTLTPKQAIAGGTGIPATAAGQPVT